MANIELDGANKKIKVDSGDLTLDVPGDIILDADGGDVVFADGGTNLLKVTNSSSDVVLQPQVDTKDIVFKQYDGTVVATVEDNATFNIPASKLAIGGTAVTSTAAELNILDGVTATAAEINLIDGGTARGTTAIADGDGVLINDAGTMRQTTVETLKTYIGGGVANADQWRITSNFSGDASPLASNWERVDTDGFGQLGSGMTESSGVFTFPSTGIWLVIVQIEHEFVNADTFTQFDLKTCTDGSSFGSASMASLGGRNDDHKSGFINHVLDVTNTSNVKCRLDLAGSHSSNISLGDTNETNTGITFLRLGDT